MVEQVIPDCVGHRGGHLGAARAVEIRRRPAGYLAGERRKTLPDAFYGGERAILDGGGGRSHGLIFRNWVISNTLGFIATTSY
jgi:hypothetical protein